MISDFGLASVYKYKGQQRQLTDRCGSPPYGPFRGSVWSRRRITDVGAFNQLLLK